MASLAEIRAKLAAQDNRKDSGGQSGDQTIYAHWNIDEGASTRLRFLPDGDPSNSFFWVERAVIKLPFAGIKGQADSKPTMVQVPCMEMYGKGNVCPILTEVRTWFKDPNLEEMGRKYWKKRAYLFQGLVRENGLNSDRPPENPIRRFIISPQIYTLVKAALMDPELENLPTDYEGGLDFTVSKTTKGGYADYSSSKWSRKESSLTAVELAAIETHGLFNLSEFLPAKPNAKELQVIKDMFEASVNGEAYDATLWDAYYKPSGYQSDNATPASTAPSMPRAATPAVAQAAAPWSDTASQTPVADSAPKASGQRAEDILAMIRNRGK